MYPNKSTFPERKCITLSDVVKDIREAIKNGELKAYYQPQYDSITSKLKSAEALARWVRSDGTIVPPMEFIPELESTVVI